MNIAELLENVLVHLPVRDLFVAQRVCAMFRDVIKESVSIQLKLFRRLAAAAPETWAIQQVVPSASKPAARYPSLFVPTTRAAAESDTVSSSHDGRSEEEIITPAALNQLCTCLTPYKGIEVGGARNTDHLRVNVQDFLSLLPTGLPSSRSWQDTFLTDPPSISAQVRIHWTVKAESHESHLSHGEVNFNVQEPGGITLGAIQRAALCTDGVATRGGNIYIHGLHKGFLNPSMWKSAGSLQQVLERLTVTNGAKIVLEAQDLDVFPI